MNSVYNQLLPDKPLQLLNNFVIAGEQYCFKCLFYAISFNPAAFSSFMSSFLKPIIRQNKITIYLDDGFITRYYNRNNVTKYR